MQPSSKTQRKARTSTNHIPAAASISVTTTPPSTPRATHTDPVNLESPVSDENDHDFAEPTTELSESDEPEAVVSEEVDEVEEAASKKRKKGKEKEKEKKPRKRKSKSKVKVKVTVEENDDGSYEVTKAMGDEDRRVSFSLRIFQLNVPYGSST